ncbi:MAG: efflux RND transporter periplasmic adaptor subunit, partial [Gemmatimonadota bacterium]
RRPGRIEAVVPAADPASRTFRVKVVIANADGAVRSGMFARLRFARGARPAVLVPAAAVVRRGQLQGVFVVQSGRAHLRWLRLGNPWESEVEVVSGLNGGEVLVLDPDAQLRDGQPVEGSGDA